MKISKLAAVGAIILAAIGASAQTGTLTPYSSYGYGILSDHATSMQRSMGGVGYAMISGRQINAMNPASYAALDTLTFLFDMGVDMTSMWQKEKVGDATLRDQRFGGGLDYVTMQFPICRNVAASVGLLPFSSVGYSFGSKIENGFDSRQGTGSINELYAGIAWRPFKGFSLGGNVSYMFGNITNDTYATTNLSYTTLYEKEMQVRDYHLNFGIQYGHVLRGTDRLSFGLTYSPAKTMLGNASLTYYDTQDISDPKVVDRHKMKGNYSLPATWGAGVAYQLGRSLMLEFDYTYQPWSKAKFRGFSNETGDHRFADRSKYAFGLQYIPNFRGSYLKRINYRAGAYFNNDYLQIGSNRLREQGVSVGFGFPVPNFKTMVNLGVEWKRRQAHPDPLIKENYINITLGINFNEMWFAQRKIN